MTIRISLLSSQARAGHSSYLIGAVNCISSPDIIATIEIIG